MNATIRTTLGLGILCLAVCGFLTACGGGSGGAGGSGSGGSSPDTNFKIFVTDAPFPGDLVESATIVIREVRVREESGGWQVVFDGSADIDLVPLTGGVVSLLTELQLAPGTYDEIRLIVDAGEVVLSDEAVIAAGGTNVFNTTGGGLHFPSGAQTGVKVKLDEPIVVVTELSTDVTLDFDLAKNFVFNGSPTMAPGVRRVIFTPVARAVNSTEAGSVGVEFVSDAGTPDDETDDAPLSGAAVTVFDDTATEVASGVTDELGGMVVQLVPGTYTIQVEAANHETTTSDPFEIFLGNRTDLGVITVAATLGDVMGVVMSDGATDADESDDIVLAGATVEITLQGEASPAASTTTDESGLFRFEALPIGTYDVAITALGHADGAVLDVTPSLGGTDVPVVLAAFTRNVTGTITDDLGDPVDGATVVVTNAAGVEIGSTATAADGTYALSLPTGAHEIVITNPATGASATQDLTVEGTDPESDQALDVQLPAVV